MKQSYPESIKYTIMGPPMPYCYRMNGYGRVYDAKKELKGIWGRQLIYQHNNRPLFSGPLHIDLVFHMGLPNVRKDKKELLRGTYHIFKPDTTNLQKFIEDVGTDVIYEDDCSVASIYAYKVYLTEGEPRTDFSVTELKNYKLLMKKEFVPKGE